MGDKSATVDLGIDRIATPQYGVITQRQLASLGLSRNAVLMRARRGKLHRVHRGVYAVGHRAMSREARWMAAVLACGPGAALSHGSAAALWGLLRRPFPGPIDVSVPSQNGRSRRVGIRIHRSVSLAASPQLVVKRNRIPVTSVARTIADLEGSVAPYLVRHAIRQAELAKLPLGPRVKADRTRSDLERDFLRLCRRHHLPAPEVNVKVGRWTVDFLWREAWLAVEADSWDYHRGRVAFQDDRARDLELRRRGFEVRRFSERQINEEPDLVVADLVTALHAAARPAPG